ncbi:MAG TPA: aminomethyl-transferring glycine dehydrogenase subunit GcvPA [Dehalococcoidia bacterium]|nr:aminomethyl-transferring glycine dehydrogenase subunit GcvPA [Dehalococcoidia bacterium]
MTSPHPYIPNTDEDRRAMLDVIGAADADELFADIPPELRIEGLDLPPALSELDLVREMTALAARNQVPGNGLAPAAGGSASGGCFLGAGAYRHFIPSTVAHIIGRSEFYTAYTPYQPEISQGTLQTMFELQSMTCELMGMDVANAGLYDGASALAEACLMACRISGRDRIALLSTVNPSYVAVVRTYASGSGLAVDVMNEPALTGDHACLAVQHPNFFGCLEDVWALGEAAHAAGALYVAAADPVSLGMLAPPGEWGVDIAVAEGQSLGWPVNFGGPYLGLFACRQEHVRQMPGRIVGRTTDLNGRSGYVLTLQTREQHIRRERATSNICTSQQLVGLAAAVYLATVGKHGLRRVAEACYHKAHYAAGRIAALPGYSLAFDKPFFKEFAVRCQRPPAAVNAALLRRGIVGGLDVSDRLENGMLLCVTEMNTREEIDRLVEGLGAVNG